MSLTSKKRAFLRKRAHNLEPIFRIGKEGFSETLAQGVLEALTPRELIKVKILQNSEVNKNDVAYEIADAIEAEVVGIIGRTIIFYKENQDKPTISLELKAVK
ncbi:MULTISPECIES: ribosome assembly RNA-binding protein YhbY [Cetobacterium]|jgi:RNA-binding protein|uniref:Ribosome assembly RNA-binding protein YhbY n=1 Tax=Candidatus Cetobacterium colombiensis TaxID=3073100 RepID=A0ABU4WAB1_9FUSO|nr:ribosome assembly RNA-binding protein YhbY [Candidatus Cetobacterium colombiensis]MDX8336480.1 ribosome assembly RNA-binding protein YhbY [Candidatus Cetobacterium colombiensis]